MQRPRTADLPSNKGLSRGSRDLTSGTKAHLAANHSALQPSINSAASRNLSPDDDKDERLKYLLKYGKVIRWTSDGQGVFAELPQIPGVWIFYRKNKVRAANPDLLDFNGAGLGHIPLMEGEEALGKLDLGRNEIQRVENLVSLQNLVILNLSHNLLSTLAGFDNIRSLHVLDLSYNFLTKVSNLSCLDQLEDLNLAHNKIEDLRGLEKNQRLAVLDLSYNRLSSSPSAMSSSGGSSNNPPSLCNLSVPLPSLSKLSLKKNQLTTLEVLPKLFPSLIHLKLSRNSLSSLQELSFLKHLTFLRGVSLYKNPLASDKSLYIQTVLSECPWLESLDHQACEEMRQKYVEEKSKGQDRGEVIRKERGDRTVASVSPSPPPPRRPSLEVLQGKKEREREVGTGQAKTEDIIEEFKNRGIVNVNKGGKKREEKEEVEAEVEESDDDLLLMDPKSIGTVKLAFEKKLKERSGTLGLDSKKDEEIWLGLPNHPIGFFKRVSNNSYRIFGDGLFMMLSSKTVNIRTVEELSFEYVFMDNLKNKAVLSYLSQIKKLKSLKLSHNNIYEYLEIVKFECFPHLVNITLENNPVLTCRYLRQFIVYRFNNLRYFNKSSIDNADLQKAKQVFNTFDKILQIPGVVSGHKKKDRGSSSAYKSCFEDLSQGVRKMRQAKKGFREVWEGILGEVLEEMG